MYASEALCIFCLPPSAVPILFQFLIPFHYSSSVFLICSPNTFTTDVPLHASHTILFPSQTLGHHSCIQHRSPKLRGKVFLHNSSAALKITVCSFQSVKSPTTSLQVYFLSSVKVHRLDSAFTNPTPYSLQEASIIKNFHQNN